MALIHVTLSLARTSLSSQRQTIRWVSSSRRQLCVWQWLQFNCTLISHSPWLSMADENNTHTLTHGCRETTKRTECWSDLSTLKKSYGEYWCSILCLCWVHAKVTCNLVSAQRASMQCLLKDYCINLTKLDYNKNCSLPDCPARVFEFLGFFLILHITWKRKKFPWNLSISFRM